MLENEEEKRPSKRIWALVEQYMQALAYFGRKMNGISKAELFVSLKESNAEEILEILDTIRQHEEQLEQVAKWQKLTGAPLQPQVAPNPHAPNGTIWITDSTTDPMTGITRSGTVTKLADCPSPYKYQTTGGKINE